MPWRNLYISPNSPVVYSLLLLLLFTIIYKYYLQVLFIPVLLNIRIFLIIYLIIVVVCRIMFPQRWPSPYFRNYKNILWYGIWQGRIIVTHRIEVINQLTSIRVILLDYLGECRVMTWLLMGERSTQKSTGESWYLEKNSANYCWLQNYIKKDYT